MSPPEGHSRRAHGDDRDQEVERGHDRARARPLRLPCSRFVPMGWSIKKGVRHPVQPAANAPPGAAKLDSIMIPAIGRSHRKPRSAAGTPCTVRQHQRNSTKFASPANAGMTNRKIVGEGQVAEEAVVRGCRRTASPVSRAPPHGASRRPPARKKKIVVAQVLHPDHLVVGVDAEIVLPAAPSSDVRAPSATRSR